MAAAQYEHMEDGEGWFATIPGFEGLWGHGETQEAAADLESSLAEWISLSVHLGHELPEPAQAALAGPAVE
jgi:predicted RNase H-like HicB family nuclease